MSKLTLQQVKKQTNSTIYMRGHSYYISGQVHNVERSGNRYKATVHGTYIYKVEITLEANGSIECSCSCPYYAHNICKHGVAVCLSIVEGNYKQDKNYISPEDFFTYVYPHVSEANKDAILHKILSENEKLRIEIIKMMGYVPTQAGISALKNLGYNDIVSYSNYLSELLNGPPLIAKNEQNAANKNEYPIEYVEIIKYIDENINKRVVNEVQKNIAAQNFTDALSCLMAYAQAVGKIELDEEYNKKNCIYLDNYSTWAKEMLIRCISSLSPHFTLKNINTKLAYRLIDNLLLLNTKSNSKYYIDDFSVILCQLCEQEETFKHFMQACNDNELVNDDTILSIIEIAQNVNQPKEWFKLCELYYLEHQSVAEKLIEKYREYEQIGNLYSAAQKIFRKWPNMDECIIKYIRPEENVEFCITVGSHLAQRTQSIEGYLSLKQLWTPEQERLFLLQNKGRDIFYMRLLEADKRYDDMFNHLNNRVLSFEFFNMTLFVIDRYPDEVIELIYKHLIPMLNQTVRGKEVYIQIAHELKKLLDKVKYNTTKQKIKDFCHYMITQPYKNLSNFKAELKKNELI